MRGVETTAGSKILEGYRPPYDATVVARLEAAGAVVLGKLNCDEFAMGSSNENSAYGPVKNPRALDRVPGGSSGGSAAAVAAGLCVATSGDGYGRVDSAAGGVLRRGGRAAYVWAGVAVWVDCVCFVAGSGWTVCAVGGGCGDDAGGDWRARMRWTLRLVAGGCGGYVGRDEEGVEGLRIGVPEEYFGEGLNAEIRAAIEKALDGLQRGGMLDCSKVSLPHTKYAVPTYYVIATAEASSNLSRFDGVRFGLRAEDANTLAAMFRNTRDEGFGAEVKRQDSAGDVCAFGWLLRRVLQKAQQVRALLTRDFLEAFAKVDAIVAPVTPTAAFKLGEKTDDPLQMYLEDIYSVAASLAGICGMSVPCGETAEGLPIGVQVLGKHFDEATMLRVGAAVEAGQTSR